LVRYPAWVSDGALKISVNGKNFAFTAHPSSFVCIDRAWKKGDVVEIKLPMHNSIEYLPNVSQYIAFMHGPILLGAKTGTEDLRGLIANDSRFGQYPGGQKLPIDKAPILVDDNIQKIADKLVPVQDKPLNFTLNVKMVNPINQITLEPFYKIHDARYMMYWMALTNSGYKSYTDSISNIEMEKMELQKRTTDAVAPGEQQPEVDHAMERQYSSTGNNMNEFWREARDGGFFSYKLGTNKETGLSLLVRYWGAENGNRSFDIYIDDQKLITENISDKWKQNRFQNVEYPIPATMLTGKEFVRVKFQATTGNTAGKVYNVRLVRIK